MESDWERQSLLTSDFNLYMNLHTHVHISTWATYKHNAPTSLPCITNYPQCWWFSHLTVIYSFLMVATVMMQLFIYIRSKCETQYFKTT